MGATVESVRIAVPGKMDFTLEFKPPFGDNPAFYANQVDELLDEAKDQARAILAARFGRQYDGGVPF